MLSWWATARPDSSFWAPVGRYLAVLLKDRAGGRSVMIYDVQTGARVAMPWDELRAGVSRDIWRADWLGGSLLNVELRLGLAEAPVAFEFNVASAMTVARGQEVGE